MISEKEVQRIAKLARIELTKKEVEKFQKDLSAILDYFELLKEVDTKNIEPVFCILKDYLKGNAAREDKFYPGSVSDELIALAPAKKGRQIKVKSVFK